MNCKFCQRKIQNKGSLTAHELSCHKNPERVAHPRGKGAGRHKGCVSPTKGRKFPQTTKRFEELYPYQEILVENSTYRRASLRKRLIRDKLIPYECSECGLGPIWQGKPMPLILDHINGINNDNRLENMRFVCSNCDTQLPTYKSKNRRKAASKVDKQT